MEGEEGNAQRHRYWWIWKLPFLDEVEHQVNIVNDEIRVLEYD